MNKVNTRTIIIAYSLVLIIFSLYSYALIDPNITLVNSAWWEMFREPMVYFGYYQRQSSSYVYIGLVLGLFLFHYLLIKNAEKVSPVKLSLLIAVILFFSFPFLSHDFFNYLFDAKIFTYYQQNPYLKTALDFPTDDWLRFMHWTHRSYPYGPVFLILSFVPSFLSFGKFILSYAFFKVMFLGFFVWSSWLLSKQNKKWAVQYMTHPLLIVEGLISLHNDLIGVALAIIGIIYLLSKNLWWGRAAILLSVGIKYLTAPFLALTVSTNKKFVWAALIGQLVILWYASTRMEIQPWYYLGLLGFIPFFSKDLHHLQLLFFGLLMAYYPYVRLGDWGQPEHVILKHQIIWTFFVLNIIYILVIKLRRNK